MCPSSLAKIFLSSAVRFSLSLFYWWFCCIFLCFLTLRVSGIISDLFPGVDLPKPDYSQLRGAMIAACEKRNLQPVESFLQKCIELFETTLVRAALCALSYLTCVCVCVRRFVTV